MKVLVDINVLLDVLQQREPYYQASAVVLSHIDRGDLTGVIAGHALTTIYYLIEKHAGRKKAQGVVDWILERFEIVPEGKAEFVRGRGLGIADFEDAVTAAAAETGGCNLIVTRNLRDFEKSPVRAVSPEELLGEL